MQHLKALTIGLAVGLAASAQAQSITVEPADPSLAAGATQAFTAEVTGLSNTEVIWLIDGIRFGAPTLGTITSTGSYAAPVDAASSLQIPIAAVSLSSPLISGSTTATVAPPTETGPSYYVATTGSDTNAGTSAEPWRTIQHAVSTVPAGATINVATGVYNELGREFYLGLRAKW